MAVTDDLSKVALMWLDIRMDDLFKVRLICVVGNLSVHISFMMDRNVMAAMVRGVMQLSLLLDKVINITVTLVEGILNDVISSLKLANLTLMFQYVSALLTFNLFLSLLLFPGFLFSSCVEERFNFVVLMIELEFFFIHVRVPLAELDESFISITLPIGSVALFLGKCKLILVISIVVMVSVCVSFKLRVEMFWG